MPQPFPALRAQSAASPPKKTPRRSDCRRALPKRSYVSASPPKNSCKRKALMSVPTATRTSRAPTKTWSRKRRSRSPAFAMRTPEKSAAHAQSSTADAPPGTVSATAAARATESAARRAFIPLIQDFCPARSIQQKRAAPQPARAPGRSASNLQNVVRAPSGVRGARPRGRERGARRAFNAQRFERRQARRLAPSILVLPALLHQHGPDGDEDEVEDEYLRALPVGRPDVALEDGVGQRQHRREDENGERLTQPVLDSEPDAYDEQRERGPPDEHLRQSDRLPEVHHLPGEGREQKISHADGDCADSA